MPSLKEIKGRIASVNSTRKITSAMKMVASSKLHHAQVAIQNMLPYETMLEHGAHSQVIPRSRGRGTDHLRSGASRQAGCPHRIYVQLLALWRFQCQHHQDDDACR